MARRSDIEYVRYYSSGSEARVLEPKPRPRHRRRTIILPQPKPEEKIELCVDPVAICGIIVAVALFACMMFGAVRLTDAQNANRAMEQYVEMLDNRHAELEHEYRNSYDLDIIRQNATALGMVPAEQVQTVIIRVEEPVMETAAEVPAWWSAVCTFFAERFA